MWCQGAENKRDPPRSIQCCPAVSHCYYAGLSLNQHWLNNCYLNSEHCTLPSHLSKYAVGLIACNVPRLLACIDWGMPSNIYTCMPIPPELSG